MGPRPKPASKSQQKTTSPPSTNAAPSTASAPPTTLDVPAAKPDPPATLPVPDDHAMVTVLPTSAPQTLPPAPSRAFNTVSDLKPTGNDWTLLAKVIGCGPVRQWNNLSATGTLQEVFLADRVGGFIRATVFNEAIGRFKTALQPGTVCTFAGGVVKYARSAVRKSADCELTFGASASIYTTDEIFDVSINQKCTSVDGISAFKDKEVVNLVGIVATVGPVKTFVSNARKPCVKRELLVIDETQKKVVCTLWGATARDDLDDLVGKPCAFFNVVVSVYNNIRSISAGMGSSFFGEPKIARADELQAWYGTGVNFSSFAHLHVA